MHSLLETVWQYSVRFFNDHNCYRNFPLNNTNYRTNYSQRHENSARATSIQPTAASRTTARVLAAHCMPRWGPLFCAFDASDWVGLHGGTCADLVHFSRLAIHFYYLTMCFINNGNYDDSLCRNAYFMRGLACMNVGQHHFRVLSACRPQTQIEYYLDCHA